MEALEKTELPSPPFYVAGGVNNLRDLGGYNVSPHASMRRNFIYRSAHLSKVTATGADTLTSELKICRIFDFRSVTEISRSPSVEIPGTTRYHVPVEDTGPEGLAVRFRDYASTDGPEGFIRAYKEILMAGAKCAFKSVFEHIRDRPIEPLLFHCTGGKDRTGVLAALILRIAGVADDNAIGYEYELTEIGLREVREDFIRQLIDFPGMDVDREGALRMPSAKAPAIIGTLKWLDDNYGNAEGYLTTAMGFTDEDIHKIKKNLLVDNKSEL